MNKKTTRADLTARRLAIGVTRHVLAERIGVREMTLYRWERGGIANIPLRSMADWERALSETGAREENGVNMLVVGNIVAEADRAEGRYGPFHSSHEAYGVLAEEVAELLEAVRSGDLLQMEREAVQVAAVAARFALCARGSADFAGRSRKK